MSGVVTSILAPTTPTPFRLAAFLEVAPRVTEALDGHLEFSHEPDGEAASLLEDVAVRFTDAGHGECSGLMVWPAPMLRSAPGFLIVRLHFGLGEAQDIRRIPIELLTGDESAQ